MNLSISLIKHELIRTTVAKAKELRPFVEKLITLGKKGGLSNIRIANSILNDKETVAKLFNDLAPRFKDRDGGYVRVVRNGFRLGDKAPMAVIEFVDRVVVNDNEGDKEEPKKVEKIQKETEKKEVKSEKTQAKKETKPVKTAETKKLEKTPVVEDKKA